MTGRFEFLSTADAPPAPQSVRLAFRAALVWAAFTALSGLVLIGAHSYVVRELIKANAKDKKPKANYVGSVVDHDANHLIISGVVTGFLSALIIVLLATMVLRAKSVGRWGLILMATVLTYVIPFGTGVLVQLLGPFIISGAPLFYRGVLLISGLACAVVLVLMSIPQTARFFAVNRSPGAPRASLFGNRGGFGRSAAGGSGTIVDVAPTQSEVTVPDDGSGAESPAGAAAARPRTRSSATRPGSVKPKGGAAPRGARAKSRNQ